MLGSAFFSERGVHALLINTPPTPIEQWFRQWRFVQTTQVIEKIQQTLEITSLVSRHIFYDCHSKCVMWFEWGGRWVKLLFAFLRCLSEEDCKVTMQQSVICCIDILIYFISFLQMRLSILGLPWHLFKIKSNIVIRRWVDEKSNSSWHRRITLKVVLVGIEIIFEKTIFQGTAGISVEMWRWLWKQTFVEAPVVLRPLGYVGKRDEPRTM